MNVHSVVANQLTLLIKECTTMEEVNESFFLSQITIFLCHIHNKAVNGGLRNIFKLQSNP